MKAVLVSITRPGLFVHCFSSPRGLGLWHLRDRSFAIAAIHAIDFCRPSLGEADISAGLALPLLGAALCAAEQDDH